ncbi:hypothetical protein [Tunturiibacter lichenicola]|uniref:hypothetical protein n=1 Tax=Tunturiibacter lichenicola TaxID=2051959 RepID=UPI003D9B8FEA
MYNAPSSAEQTAQPITRVERVQRTDKPFQTADKILPPEICNKLTYGARRFFAGLWNVSNWRCANPCWIDEALVAKRSSVLPENLDRVRQELMGLKLIKFTPGEVGHRGGKSLYLIVDPEAEALAEWQSIFPEPVE